MRLFFTSLFLLLWWTVSSSPKQYEFQYLTNADGLSSSAISSIYQDPEGVMWFGSWDGLNSYDGRDFKTYKSVASNPNTLTNNLILGITGGVAGNEIWVTTFRGINRLDTGSGKIDRFFFGFDSIMPPHYNTFCTVRSGDKMYCSFRNSVYWFDEGPGRFEELDVLPGDELITKIFADDQGILWIQRNWTDLYRYIPRKDDDGRPGPGECSRVLHNISVNSLFEKDERSFWIRDTDSNLYLFDTHSSQLTLIVKLGGTVPAEITSVMQKEDDIYISSSSGVWVYSYRDGRIREFEGIEAQWVFTMSYCSRQDIVWFGTNGNGVIKMYPGNRLFHSIPNDRLLSHYRKSQIRSFYEDVNGDIWVGSRGDGISVISGIGTPEQKIRHLPESGSQSVMSITRGKGNDIFVGTESGRLMVFRSGSLKSIGMLPEADLSGSEGIYSMYWDDERNTLWAGLNGNGLLRMDMAITPQGYTVTDHKKYCHDPNDPATITNDNCFAILPAGRGRLWIGTRGGGLNLMDTGTGTFTAIKHTGEVALSDNEVFCLARSRDGGVWAGTSYGLNKLAYDADGRMTVKQYTEEDGILNNTVHGVVQDDRGIIWMSTNKGITKLDPGSGSIVNYCDGYGLQSNEFSDLAYLRASDGMIYFGGINGINYFMPSQISERKFVPKIKITSLVINNTPASLADKKKQRGTEDIILLKHNENFFNISFVALDFIDNANCEYSYILEGFNKEWVRAGVNNNAVFTNVPPGRYTLRIRSTNGDKVWADNEYSQEIRIAVPWWNGWQAHTVYILLFAAAAYAAYIIINRRVKLKRWLFLERLEKKKQQQIHDARLRFFTNIAHEFITPLTLIYGPVERLIDSRIEDEESTKYLKVIKSNAERMQKLITELMDFRKIDSGHREPVPECVDLNELVLYIADNFIEFADQMSIDFRYSVDLALENWVTDRGCLEKILFNLISNAYKYTNENGRINLSLVKQGDDLIIRVYNTGRGIKTRDLDSVFDNFHILDNFEQQVKKGIVRRTGIGLALTKSLVNLLGGEISVASEENRYVEFTVRLPRIPLPERSVTSPPEIYEYERPSVPPGDRKRSVLIVEDEPQIRELIRDILRDDYHIVEAAGGKEALEAIKKKRPDLIISDVEMPGMNGLELLGEIKNNKFTTHIPVVFISVKATVEQQIAGIQKGSEYFIPKPFNPRHVAVVVNQVLNNREQLKDYYNSPLRGMEEYKGRMVKAEDEEFIERITEIIERNLSNEDLNSTMICDELLISRIQLYRKLKSVLDMTPGDFIRQVKLNHAARLLKTTSLTVQEIMFRSGFNNRSYFYSVFKKEFNLSPLDLRGKAPIQ